MQTDDSLWLIERSARVGMATKEQIAAVKRAIRAKVNHYLQHEPERGTLVDIMA